MDYGKLGDAINGIRYIKEGNRTVKKGLREIAPLIGISHNTLSRIEQGNVCDLESYEKICKFLNVSMDTFKSEKP